MWTDAGADVPRCPGSGAASFPAPMLANGFPGGRALCEACLTFVPLEAGRLVEHDTWSAASDSSDRAEWFNTLGFPDR
jgi:hypothetical protein